MSNLDGFAQNPSLKIGLIADVQYCDCPTAGTRHYQLSLGKTEEAVKELVSQKVDLTVLLGDVIDRDFKSFGPVFERLRPLGKNVVIVAGNHDLTEGERKKAKSERKIIRRQEVKIKEGVRMLFLNGMVNSMEGWPEGSRKYEIGLETYNRLKSEGAPNAQEWNGGLGEEQLRWIRHQVKKSNRNHQSLILFCHMPALPGDAHSLWDTPQLLEILKHADKQVLYLCGHKHSGGDDTIGNVRVINLKGMVEGTTNAFGILSVYPDRFELTGYGRQESMGGKF
ncbi:MAG: hypothetical protein A2X22_00300 [Bacteroidetes bacterium GWF2_49_14]|nr:MAG: hypothetical protein A2X22_00300 [Bacteroidetes bacterium GWF2_49_14]